MIFWTYFVNMGVFFGLMFQFIAENRCFVRDGGKRYTNNVGVDFDYTTAELWSCYAHWAFASWLLLFVLAAFIIMVYLKGQQAPITKITFWFAALDISLIFLSSFAVVGDGHDALMGHRQ